MRTIVSQKNLRIALNVVEKIVSKNTSLPVLNNVLLKTENGRMKISATNLEMGINYIIGAKIDEAGEITVPARIFSDFINNLTDEKIYLTVRNNILHINSDNYKTQILGFSAKDFPIIPKIKNGATYTLPARALKNCLMSVLDSVATSEARPELSGVFFSFSNNKAVFAATDSFRLAEKTIDIKTDQGLSAIIPRNTVAELVRITSEIEGDLNIRSADNQIVFFNEDFELVSRLIDGSYPDYKKVIPEKAASKVLVDKEKLERNIRLAGLFSSNISDIKLNCLEDKMFVLAKNSGRGEIETSIESILKNNPFDVSLNFHYLLDGLKIINADKVLVEFTGTSSPLVIRPAEEKEGLVYLIMPLRN